MKTVLASVALVLLATVGGAADEKNFTSEDGKYAVAFPAKSKYRSGILKEAGIASPFIEGTVGKNQHKVMYFDLPEAIRDIAPTKLFDAGEDGEVKKTKGKLISSKEGKWGPDKLPYRDFVLEIGANTFRYRIILNDLRCYIVIAGGPDEFGTTADATKFFDSFELTK